MHEHPPIDPEFVAAMLADEQYTPTLLPQDIPARRLARPVDPQTLRRGGAITLTERRIPGPSDNPEIAITLLRPATGSNGAGIFYIHGGGMVMGTPHHIESSILDAVQDGATVVSVEYRLAPEHPYPAAIEDCYAAVVWTAANADDLGFDSGRLAIAGSSAGGGLAAGVALLARDRGGPALTHQILFCPMLDDRESTHSSQELDGHGQWDRRANRTGWSAYLGERRGGDDVPVYAAPARAVDLSGLPPAFIDVGDVETFRDEDIDYAARLSRAGVPVELHVWPGGVHGFVGLAPAAALSRAATAVRRAYLERNALIHARVP